MTGAQWYWALIPSIWTAGAMTTAVMLGHLRNRHRARVQERVDDAFNDITSRYQEEP